MARQRAVGQRRADELNLRIVHEIVEMGASAATFKNRVAFQALRNFLDDHPDVRHVILPSLGRISRSWRNLQVILHEFEVRDISIVTFDGRTAQSRDIAAGMARIAFLDSDPNEGETAAGGVK
ncbi:recombinase family protein [Nocardia brasiliensis]|uniref:recombinase family protein n=1 Tax=Nocardia brasiliensis TaxID=37326 RepID=UPI003A5D15B9